MQRLSYMKTLGFRLSLVVGAVVLVGICLIAGLFIAQDFQKTVASEKLRLTSVASAFSAAASKAVAAGDRRSTLEVVRGIADLPHTRYVAVNAPNGSVIAELGSGVSLVGRDGDADEKSNFGFLRAETIVTSVPVRFGGEQVGTLQIHSDIGWLRSRYLEGLSNILAIALLAVVLTAIAANVLISRLTKPLRKLSHKLTGMGDNPDLSQRFDHDRQDEIGVLAAAFNDAFSRIEERDRAIRIHRDTLEETVETRTRELKNAVVEADRANAAKSDFLATMSHEIRTPMNGMMVMAELLTASPLSPKHHRYAQVISRSGRSLLNIINDILDMSKIESGRLELEQIPFSIDALVEDTVSLFSARAGEKGLSLAMHVGMDVGHTIIGDPTRLGQVISNLTNNALKFTETGGVTIYVTAESRRTENRQRLHIKVSDTGIGIAENKLDAIFEQFTQADQSTTRNFGGTGLGLPISQKLVEAMDGKISVTSSPGTGTTFYVEIDFATEHQNTDEAPSPACPGYRAVVLDPDPITSAATAAAFTERGFEIIQPEENRSNPDADIILARPGELGQTTAAGQAVAGNIPIVLTRQHGEGVKPDVPDNVVVADLSLPLARSNIDTICNCLLSGDFSELAAQETAFAKQVELPKFDGLTVLAVDDDAVNREVLNESLTALGVNATFAESGEQAVAEMLNSSFDIVFMDCSMPGMDGYEATARIRKIEQEAVRASARIVALTAHVTGPEAERWREAGMDGYISKPFTIAQLAGELEAKAQASSSPDTASSAPDTAGGTTLEDDLPLISSEMLDLFQSVGAANGVDMMERVFSLFRQHAPEASKSVVDAIQDGSEPAEVAKLLHALKSMCNSGGAARAAAICDRLEIDAGEGVLPKADDINRMATTVSQTMEAMHNLQTADQDMDDRNAHRPTPSTA